MSDGFVLPFYLVCDESYSMSGEPIAAINAQMPELHNHITNDPTVSDIVEFGIVAFSSDAEVTLPLSNLSDVSAMPALEAGGGTSYAAAFEVLRQQIIDDVARLKSDGHRVYRPAAFFLSDGYPTDPEPDWRASFQALTSSSFNERPNVISFGVGDADPIVIKEIGTLAAFNVENNADTAKALTEFARALTKSVMQSASAAAAGQVGMVLPETPEGFVRLDEM